MGRSRAREHLVVVNFPNESRVRQIIDEFTRDEHHRDGEIVLVTDQIAELPFELPNVTFVRGSPLEQETFERMQHDPRLAGDHSEPELRRSAQRQPRGLHQLRDRAHEP